jgi:hypothetical protein
MKRSLGNVVACITFIAATLSAGTACAQTAGKPYRLEWVFHVKWGHQHDWWKIFQKYQIATLDREKELGYITDYTIDAPVNHASDDSRWDYRIIITFSSYEASEHSGEVERELFPDRATQEREEQQRWDLTLNHWDMPLERVDPHG